MYARVENGVIVEYPVTSSSALEITGKKFPTIQELVDCNLYVVFPTDKGSAWDKNYIEETPRFDGNVWRQVWSEVDANEEEIASRRSNKWKEVRKLRDRLLHITDWTQLHDSPINEETKLQYQEYRQQLRDITNQESPFDVWFPEAPEA